jgi:hypothetical protein
LGRVGWCGGVPGRRPRAGVAEVAAHLPAWRRTRCSGGRRPARRLSAWRPVGPNAGRPCGLAGARRSAWPRCSSASRSWPARCARLCARARAFVRVGGGYVAGSCVSPLPAAGVAIHPVARPLVSPPCKLHTPPSHRPPFTWPPAPGPPSPPLPPQTSLAGTLETIAEAVQELVGAERVAVFLMDHARGVLWSSFAHPATGQPRQIRCTARARARARGRGLRGAGEGEGGGRVPRAARGASAARDWLGPSTRGPSQRGAPRVQHAANARRPLQTRAHANTRARACVHVPPPHLPRSTHLSDGLVGRCAAGKQQLALDLRRDAAAAADPVLRQLEPMLEGGRRGGAVIVGGGVCGFEGGLGRGALGRGGARARGPGSSRRGGGSEGLGASGAAPARRGAKSRALALPRPCLGPPSLPARAPRPSTPPRRRPPARPPPAARRPQAGRGAAAAGAGALPRGRHGGACGAQQGGGRRRRRRVRRRDFFGL